MTNNTNPLQNIFTLRQDNFNANGDKTESKVIEGCRIVVSEDASDWLKANASLKAEQITSLLSNDKCEADCALDPAKTYYQYSCQPTKNAKTTHWSATYFVDNGTNNEGAPLPW